MLPRSRNCMLGPCTNKFRYDEFALSIAEFVRSWSMESTNIGAADTRVEETVKQNKIHSVSCQRCANLLIIRWLVDIDVIEGTTVANWVYPKRVINLVIT